MLTIRYRSITWFATGAAIALIVVAAFQALDSTAAGPAGQAVFVPIEPCRLFDYRPAPDTVGTRTRPLGPNETHTQQVTGEVGNCDIPAEASAIAMNVTAVSPSEQSNLRLFPADQATPPLVSNLNYSAGQAPVPNKVDVKLSPTGAIKLLNLRGIVFVIGDVVGYYVSGPLTDLEAQVAALEADKAAQDLRIAALEAADAAQDTRITDAEAKNAEQDLSINLNGDVASANQTKVDALLTDMHVIPSGTTVTGTFAWDDTIALEDDENRPLVLLPGRAPLALDDGQVSFAAGTPDAADATVACDGTVDTPTAPAGEVCIYVAIATGVDSLSGDAIYVNGFADRGFSVRFLADGASGNMVLAGSWAYTAP